MSRSATTAGVCSSATRQRRASRLSGSSGSAGNSSAGKPLLNNMQDLKTNDSVEQKAAAFAERVTALSKDRPLRDAIGLATAQDTEGAEAYRLAGIGTEPVNDASAAISLSARTGESFDDLVSRYANEKGVPLRVAAHEVGRARPDLAATRG